ncbi:MAG: Nif3-like dinuclear metal center hexameric protein [Deltaproteobacteria bacterium]|nr:MAG: Nif3-like dinuclear metal center hexameric protein [Deltaproteobacteria bacterium]
MGRTALKLSEICHTLAAFAPLDLAQPWDNVGLIAGERGGECTCVLLTVDLTAAVLDEAISKGCDLIVAYHPPIFKPIARLEGGGSGMDGLLWRAIRHGIAVYSPHTALDAAQGGTNDVLADLCGAGEREPFEFVTGRGEKAKVVVFVPPDAVEEVALAMSRAGAGVIGEYERCSFRLRGTGTFLGRENTHPTVGEAGRFEQVEEIRLEMVAPKDALPAVIEAIGQTHPYEEPAYDVYPLTLPPRWGIGRLARLESPLPLRGLLERLVAHTPATAPLIVGKREATIDRVAVIVGAAGSIPLGLDLTESDCVVTGEIRHHDALALLRHGTHAIALGHWASERPTLPHLARRLMRRHPGLPVVVSEADRDPFESLEVPE